MTIHASNTIVRHLEQGETCCDPDWEAAYARFESPAEEIAKFAQRLRKLGVDQLPKDQHVAEIFCGRGGGLVALEQLGFNLLSGVDLSEDLLSQYQGPATLHLADCRDLPFESQTLDAVVVQGGLHHLPSLPGDLKRVIGEVARVLRPAGRFFVVEPWLTPFLSFVHAVVKQPIVRRLYRKGDALAEMIHYERKTYEAWLAQPSAVLECIEQRFEVERKSVGWGKLMLIATPIPSPQEPESTK